MGRAAARLLVDDGADVVAVDINPVEVPVTAAHQTDLTDPAAVDALVQSIDGPVDILLNCAGGAVPGVKGWKLNFFGLRRLTEGLLPKMRSGSAIANVASKAGIDWHRRLDDLLEVLQLDDAAGEKWLEAHPESVANSYGWSKSAVIVYTYARAAELAPQGIRMNCILPGAVDTGFFGGANPLDNPNLVRSISHVGRLSTPEEQAYPLLFLASEAASYVSGASIIIDAGGTGGYLTGRLQAPELPTYDDIRHSPRPVI
jgi:NAD(P)-dependent dehydrogenase (short-subunit alcohol dehydrogenase family)